jgi:glucokinase
VTVQRVVALDLGGTHVSAATVDVGSAAVVHTSHARANLSPGAGRDELLARICDTARAARFGGAEAAGVAAPGPFDYDRGVCLLEHKLESLYGVDLRTELVAALRLPPEAVRFVNDAEAFVLGEWWAGAARGHERALGITIGTGLGSAFLDRGRIVRRGAGVPARGELYRVPFRDAPVEVRISRGAILSRYGGERVDVADVAERARSGDARARETFDALARDLAEFVGPWLTTFAPTCLVVGGSIARSWDLLRDGLEPLEAHVDVLARAEHIDDAPLLGAARHVLSEHAS